MRQHSPERHSAMVKTLDSDGRLTDSRSPVKIGRIRSGEAFIELEQLSVFDRSTPVCLSLAAILAIEPLKSRRGAD